MLASSLSSSFSAELSSVFTPTYLYQVPTNKKKGFNFELYKFYYLLPTILHYVVVSIYLKEHSMYICSNDGIRKEKKDISNLI